MVLGPVVWAFVSFSVVLAGAKLLGAPISWWLVLSPLAALLLLIVMVGISCGMRD